jgi:hypothetical protein
VYTVGDNLKPGDVGLASAAVFGCRWVAPTDERGAEGDSGAGTMLLGRFDDNTAPKVILVGVRAGLRSGIE